MAAEDWDDTYDEQWAHEVAGWPWKREGDVFRVEGSCPRCGHGISREFEKASVGLRRLTSDPSAEETSVEITISCNCTGTHAGRPKGVQSGCGKSVLVRLPL